MSNTIEMMDTSNPETVSADVEIYDPPMCCPTGLCGPTLDQTLLNVNEMILALKHDNVSVERYQMTSHPQQFIGNGDVMRLVQKHQMNALPITFVRGNVIKVGEYPTLAEVRNALNGDQT